MIATSNNKWRTRRFFVNIENEVFSGHETPSAPHRDLRALQDPRDRLQHQFEGPSANSGTSSTPVKFLLTHPRDDEDKDDESVEDPPVLDQHNYKSAPHHDPRVLQDPRDRLQHQVEGQRANSGTSSTSQIGWRNHGNHAILEESNKNDCKLAAAGDEYNGNNNSVGDAVPDPEDANTAAMRYLKNRNERDDDSVRDPVPDLHDHRQRLVHLHLPSAEVDRGVRLATWKEDIAGRRQRKSIEMKKKKMQDWIWLN